jgi:hypothetical protein
VIFLHRGSHDTSFTLTGDHGTYLGPLPDAIQQRLQNATPEELEHWARRMLEVDSLDAVFSA